MTLVLPKQHRAELILGLLIDGQKRTLSELGALIGCSYDQARAAVFTLGPIWHFERRWGVAWFWLSEEFRASLVGPG